VTGLLILLAHNRPHLQIIIFLNNNCRWVFVLFREDELFFFNSFLVINLSQYKVHFMRNILMWTGRWFQASKPEARHVLYLIFGLFSVLVGMVIFSVFGAPSDMRAVFNFLPFGPPTVSASFRPIVWSLPNFDLWSKHVTQ
jgi:hypothetical protein